MGPPRHNVAPLGQEVLLVGQFNATVQQKHARAEDVWPASPRRMAAQRRLGSTVRAHRARAASPEKEQAKRSALSATLRIVKRRIAERVRTERKLARGTALMRAVGRYLVYRRTGAARDEGMLGEEGTGGCLGIRCRSTLDGLYGALVESLEDRAVAALALLWLPIATLFYRKRRRRESVQQWLVMRPPATRTRLAMEALRNSEVFAKWPQALLEELVDKAVPSCSFPGEVLLHEGEPAAQAMAVLLSGSVTVLKRKKGAAKKGFSRKDAGNLVGVGTAPLVFGQFSLLCDEPRMASAVVNGSADVAFIKQADFLKYFWELPHTLRLSVTENALAQRKYNLINTFQVTEEQLRKASLFRDFPQEHVQMIRERLKPKVVGPGTQLCAQGDKAQDMFFIARGRVGLRVVTTGGSVMEVATLTSGAVFGEWGLLFSERRTATAVALGVVELWVLSREDFFSITNNPAVKEPLRNSVNAQRLSGLQKMRVQFAPTLTKYILGVPLLRRLLTPETAQALQPLFEPRVYSSGDIMCTRSQVANRIIVVTRGKAFVQDGGPKSAMLCIGEAIGYTCLLVHRWLHPVVAVSNVDTWELRRSDFIRFLQQRRLWTEMVRMTCLIMQPYVDAEYLPKTVRGGRPVDPADAQALMSPGVKPPPAAVSTPPTRPASPPASPGAPSLSGQQRSPPASPLTATIAPPSPPDSPISPMVTRSAATEGMLGRLKMSLVVRKLMLLFVTALQRNRVVELKKLAKRKRALQTKFERIPPRLTQPCGKLRCTKKKEKGSANLPPDFESQVRKLGRSASMGNLQNPDLYPVRNEKSRVFPTAQPEGVATRVQPRTAMNKHTLSGKEKFLYGTQKCGLCWTPVGNHVEASRKHVRAVFTQRANELLQAQKLMLAAEVKEVRKLRDCPWNVTRQDTATAEAFSFLEKLHSADADSSHSLSLLSYISKGKGRPGGQQSESGTGSQALGTPPLQGVRVSGTWLPTSLPEAGADRCPSSDDAKIPLSPSPPPPKKVRRRLKHTWASIASEMMRVGRRRREGFGRLGAACCEDDGAAVTMTLAEMLRAAPSTQPGSPRSIPCEYVRPMTAEPRCGGSPRKPAAEQHWPQPPPRPASAAAVQRPRGRELRYFAAYSYPANGQRYARPQSRAKQL